MDFKQAEESFEVLKSKFAAGTLSEADFKAQLEELMIQDEKGAWWMIGYETGQWYRNAGEDWVRAEPPGHISKLSGQRAEEEAAAKAKEEADRLAAQKAEAERLAKQRAEEERLAKAKAETDRKAKEEADRVAAQNAQAGVAPQKKSGSKGLVIAIVVVVLLIAGGIGVTFLGKSGSNKASNVQAPVVQPTRTQAPAPTKKPTTKATEPQAPAPAPTEKAKSTATVEAPPPTVPVVNVESLIKTAHILVYEDTAEEGLWIEPMMKKVGYADNAKFVHDRIGDLKNELTASGASWDLIIIAAESHSAVSGELWVYVKEQLDAGTPVIIETWTIHRQLEGKIKPIMEACGVSFQETMDVAVPVFWYQPDNPFFNDPNRVSELSKTNRYWSGESGDLLKLSPGSNATILAGTSSSLTDAGTIISCYDGRMILQTFSNHDYPKAQISDLWQNYIYNTLKNHFSK